MRKGFYAPIAKLFLAKVSFYLSPESFKELVDIIFYGSVRIVSLRARSWSWIVDLGVSENEHKYQDKK